MKAGDVVRYTWSAPSCDDYKDQNGIVLEVNKWVDSGAPDRNFGVDVKVLWSNGQIETFDEVELSLAEVINE